jgi:hypothetical protein
LVTGQLKPQPSDVMARNRKPAGAMRTRCGALGARCGALGARTVGFDSVMEPGEKEIRGHHAPSFPPPLRVRGHGSPENLRKST